jgi:hypothetical protein
MKAYKPSQLGPVLYHLTHEDFIDKILADGLVPQHGLSMSGEPVFDARIYVSRSKSYVDSYAQGYGPGSILLLIQTNRLSESIDFYRDEEDWTEDPTTPVLLFTTKTIHPGSFEVYGSKTNIHEIVNNMQVHYEQEDTIDGTHALCKHPVKSVDFAKKLTTVKAKVTCSLCQQALRRMRHLANYKRYDETLEFGSDSDPKSGASPKAIDRLMMAFDEVDAGLDLLVQDPLQATSSDLNDIEEYVDRFQHKMKQIIRDNMKTRNK